MTSSSTCPVSEYLKSLGLRVHDTRIMLHLAVLKHIPHVLPQFTSKLGLFAVQFGLLYF